MALFHVQESSSVTKQMVIGGLISVPGTVAAWRHPGVDPDELKIISGETPADVPIPA